MELLVLLVLLCFIYMYIQSRNLRRRFADLRSQVEQLERGRERENEERNEKISSHSFELLDGDGRARARLETSEEGPCLVLYDVNGQVPTAFFGFSGEKHPQIGLFYSGRPVAYGVRNAEATNLAEMDATEARLGISDSQITLSIDDEGYPALSMYARERWTASPSSAVLHVHRTHMGKEAELFLDAQSGVKQDVQYLSAHAKSSGQD